jgi:pimeloyl-ACP methyl ester carboxylesterase
VRHPGNTLPFRGPTGDVVPGSIAEVGYLRLGGLDQWVMVRGRSVANPVLVLLHGGPGFPEMRLYRHFNAALEQIFTVVYWEQRGTGKSFDRRIPESSMTVARFIADLDELVDAMRVRLGKSKVALYGHSWGSALGVLYANRFPDKVAAYVGTGQVGDWPASEASSYAFVLTEAVRRGNRRALKQLRAIGPPPYGYRSMELKSKWLVRFAGVARGIPLWKLLRISLAGPESSILDLPGIMRGMLFSTRTLWPEASRLNLVEAVPALPMPVFFFIGRHDHVVAAETSGAYFERLRAGAKTLVWFEESAHEPGLEEPAKFNAAMAELVRPLLGGT